MTRAAAYDRDVALDAAMAVFWDKGYHATSLKDLEQALCMKPGSIYAAFTSKENLYLLALERYFDKSRAGFQGAMARARSPLFGLANHFRSYAMLCANDKARQACMLTKTLVDTRTTDPVIVERSRLYMDAMLSEFRVCFLQAIAQGELPKTADAGRLARRFQANITALRLEFARGTAADELRCLAEDMALEIEALHKT